MAYQNISFPAMKLLHGFTQEVEAPTTIVTNFAKEYRINRYSAPKFKFVFASRNMATADVDILLAFFDTVGWQRDSFNFTNPNTSVVYKVRLDNIPSAQVVALNSNNSPKIFQVSDIILKQVFNE
jgi:hypothetical protein